MAAPADPLEGHHSNMSVDLEWDRRAGPPLREWAAMKRRRPDSAMNAFESVQSRTRLAWRRRRVACLEGWRLFYGRIGNPSLGGTRDARRPVQRLEDRDGLLEDAPETYYVTEVLRTVSRGACPPGTTERDALHDLLSISRQLTLAKARVGGARRAIVATRPVARTDFKSVSMHRLTAD